MVVTDDATLAELRTSPALPSNCVIEHVVVNEYRDYNPPSRQHNKKHAFAYGTTQYIASSAVSSYFEGLLRRAEAFNLPVIPVFHAIKSDMTILGNNNIDVLNGICRKALDTQKLFRGQFHSRNFATPGLKDLIEDHLKIDPALCHNAGNDAMYTMMLLMLKIWSMFD
jgi:hypothetical protein